jgi:hypothetical protein
VTSESAADVASSSAVAERAVATFPLFFLGGGDLATPFLFGDDAMSTPSMPGLLDSSIVGCGKAEKVCHP